MGASPESVIIRKFVIPAMVSQDNPPEYAYFRSEFGKKVKDNSAKNNPYPKSGKLSNDMMTVCQ
ncbi:Uncharacterized protein dnm_078890 [Desulfonema magnum]|uniref:Uncharacterized protein n=1 Tax=Desulfonema magnum TaxID=45655 RepID=A0A975GS92_9BACT|nr:Uncharacterized protein dnm_078890 [Desulfonema magnum]